MISSVQKGIWRHKTRTQQKPSEKISKIKLCQWGTQEWKFKFVKNILNSLINRKTQEKIYEKKQWKKKYSSKNATQ